MIPTDNYSARTGGRVRLVCLHTTEGATNVDSLGAFFQHGTDQASYHNAFDDRRIESYVNYSFASWSIRSGNGFSDNAAYCAAAVRDKWTRADWLAHPRMLEISAGWVAERCMARGLPIRRLTPAEVHACRYDPGHPGGVIMHWDYTVGAPDGTHTDNGDAFPFDLVLDRARQIAGQAPALLITLPQTAVRRRRDEDNNMELPISTTRRDYQVPTDVVGGWCGAANLLLTANTDGNAKSAKVFGIYAAIWRGGTPPQVIELQRNDAGAAFTQWWPWKGALPAGTTSVIVSYLAPQGMVARVEYER